MLGKAVWEKLESLVPEWFYEADGRNRTGNLLIMNQRDTYGGEPPLY